MRNIIMLVVFFVSAVIIQTTDTPPGPPKSRIIKAFCAVVVAILAGFVTDGISNLTGWPPPITAPLPSSSIVEPDNSHSVSDGTDSLPSANTSHDPSASMPEASPSATPSATYSTSAPELSPTMPLSQDPTQAPSSVPTATPSPHSPEPSISEPIDTAAPETETPPLEETTHLTVTAGTYIIPFPLTDKNAVIYAKTSLAVDQVTLTWRNPGESECTKEMHSQDGTTWTFDANFYIAGTYDILITAYAANGQTAQATVRLTYPFDLI